MSYDVICGINDVRMLYNFFLIRISNFKSKSPKAHVAKFYGRIRLISDVLKASKFSK